MSKNKYLFRFIILTCVSVLIIISSIFVGRYYVSPTEFFKCIFGIGNTLSESAKTIMFNVRLPRVLSAVLIGSALSVAGASYQGMFQNPMVSPDILGASSGASFGAALGIILGFGYVSTSISSFLLGICAVLCAYFLSRLSKRTGNITMILAGMMISSLFSSGTSFIKLVSDTQSQLPAITYWLMGSLSSIKMSDVAFISFPIILGLIVILCLSFKINVLTVGDDESRSMGVNTVLIKMVIIICATLITSASVSVSGMIGWVGLVIPHFSRRLFGYDYRRIIPSCILMGSGYLVFIDTIARTCVTSEVPIGILTSFVGAPVFLWMIFKGGENKHGY